MASEASVAAVHQPNKRPQDSAFKQQRLKAWQPLLTPKWVIGTFAMIGIVFLIIGIVMVSVGSSVLEKEVRYDNECESGVCTASLVVDKAVEGPVYFYYKIANFYQNHRRFVKSRDDKQLRGAESDLSNCEPLIQSPLQPSKALYPCGLIANSFFNDVIEATLTEEGGTPIRLSGDSWSSDDIIWPSDAKKFINSTFYSDSAQFTRVSSRDGETITLPPVTDPDLIVWMRTAGLPTFKKLYRKRAEGLTAGSTLKFTIQDNFDVSDFSGKKYVVVATTSALGGKNVFLSWAYVVVGILCMLTAAGFSFKQHVSPRKPGDLVFWEKDHHH